MFVKRGETISFVRSHEECDAMDRNKFDVGHILLPGNDTFIKQNMNSAKRSIEIWTGK